MRARRLTFRRRGLALSLGALLALGGGAAVAADAVSTRSATGLLQVGSRGAPVRSLQHALGLPTSGRFGQLTLRAVRRYQRQHGLAVDGIAGPITLGSLGLVARAARVAVPSQLARIAACESGGDPRAVSASGTYRGKYQFDRSTWASVGGSGDPAAAPEAEQDRRASLLYARRGAAPWGVCGRR